MKKSNCCNAPIQAITADEGTSYWQCNNCGKPCDVKVGSNEQEKEWWELRLEILEAKEWHVGNRIDPQIIMPERKFRMLKEFIGMVVTEAERRMIEKCVETLLKEKTHYKFDDNLLRNIQDEVNTFFDRLVSKLQELKK